MAFFCLMVVLSFTAPAIAQDISNPASSNVRNTPTQFSLWGGYSFNSVRFLGKTPDSQTTIFGLGIEKKLKQYNNGNMLFYSADIIPLLQYQYPKRDEAGRRTELNGFGLSPVGFKAIHPISNDVFPFIQTTAGVVYMEKTFPTDLARRLNFTFDVSLGTNIRVSNHSTFTLGYKFHHISNAQTGSENPGLDSNFFFLSFSIY